MAQIPFSHFLLLSNPADCWSLIRFKFTKWVEIQKKPFCWLPRRANQALKIVWSLNFSPHMDLCSKSQRPGMCVFELFCNKKSNIFCGFRSLWLACKEDPLCLSVQASSREFFVWNKLNTHLNGIFSCTGTCVELNWDLCVGYIWTQHNKGFNHCVLCLPQLFMQTSRLVTWSKNNLLNYAFRD